jgi:hypothetical protein
MTKFRYPSIEEIRALELAARRARAEEVGRLIRVGVGAVKSVFSLAPVRVVTHHRA